MARDIFHVPMKEALVNESWQITHDPLHLQYGRRDLYIDLGAEELVAAEKAGRKIAVDVKSFIGESEIDDLKGALGTFVLYRNLLKQLDPERELYLAIRESTYNELFSEPIGKLIVEAEKIWLIIFDPEQRRIVKWIR